jgi:hypothetical protein
MSGDGIKTAFAAEENQRHFIVQTGRMMIAVNLPPSTGG